MIGGMLMEYVRNFKSLLELHKYATELLNKKADAGTDSAVGKLDGDGEVKPY